MSRIAVISTGRPENVEKMHELLGGGEGVVWVVKVTDVADYRAAGADTVAAPSGVAVARNVALDHYKDTPHFQLSDDLKGMKMLKDGTAQPIAVRTALEEMEDALEWSDFRLCGVAPTNNPFFGKEKSSTNLFILGDMMFIAPNELRFDERLRLKEDYDYTIQHYKRYGGALRLDWLLPSFVHKTNKGGVVSDVRSISAEQETIKYLKHKWGNIIRDNPRRPNEILLNLPRRDRETLS